MADGKDKGNSVMAFVLGAVVVVLIGLGWYVLSGGDIPSEDEPDIEVELPDIETGDGGG